MGIVVTTAVIQIQIEISLLLHGGGTKFYQVFQMTSRTGRVATLIHYGKIAGMRQFRPILGGRSKLSANTSEEVSSRIKEKIARGYYIDASKSIKIENYSDSAWWTETFGAENAFQIISMLFDRNVAPESGADNLVSGGGHITAQVNHTDPEGWGSW